MTNNGLKIFMTCPVCGGGEIVEKNGINFGECQQHNTSWALGPNLIQRIGLEIEYAESEGRDPLKAMADFMENLKSQND